MAIRVVRLGTARLRGEGPRLGTVRRPPRGVKKADYGRRNYFDVWLPELAPSAPLVSWALSESFTPRRWARYARKYRGEMRRPAAARLIATLAALSREANFSVGCYCENEELCHRTLLRQLLAAEGSNPMFCPDCGDEYQPGHFGLRRRGLPGRKEGPPHPNPLPPGAGGSRVFCPSSSLSRAS